MKSLLFPLDIVRGEDTLSTWITLTSVSHGIPVDDLPRMVGAACWSAQQKERICTVVPSSVSVGFCDGRVMDFLSKDEAKA